MPTKKQQTGLSAIEPYLDGRFSAATGAAEGIWLRRGVYMVVVFAVILVPPFLFGANPFRMEQFSRCLTMALLALAMDLVWGYSGLLSLGQGLYFGLGAYSVAYSLKMKQEAILWSSRLETNLQPGDVPPDFMRGYASWSTGYVNPLQFEILRPLANIWIALAVAVMLPMLLGLIFSLVASRRGIRGVYFCLLTQAMAQTFFFLVDNTQKVTGGRPGINEAARLNLFGYTFDDMVVLYWTIAAIVLACLAGLSLLVCSKFGKILIAVRDNEPRVRALGYDTAMYKMFAFTVASGLSGLAGALFVAVNGKIGPFSVDIPFSVMVAVFVAFGGRGTLAGAVVGAVLVHFGESYIGELAAEWLFGRIDTTTAASMRWIIIGVLFVLVVVFLPKGIVGTLTDLIVRVKRLVLRKPQPGLEVEH